MRGVFLVTTADTVTEQALTLAATGSEGEGPVQQLLQTADNRRVAVVKARQNVLAIRDEGSDDRAEGAVVLLDAVLDQMPI